MVRIIFVCDEWKSWDSMRMVGLFKDNDELLIKSVKELIDESRIDIEGYSIEDINVDNIESLNDMLRFFYMANVEENTFSRTSTII